VPADVEPQQLTSLSRPQSMRFGTWFQRYSQPVSVTAEYEEGS
jgi:CCR4-NOT transcriptional regulation complex NOT5 subunit